MKPHAWLSRIRFVIACVLLALAPVLVACAADRPEPSAYQKLWGSRLDPLIAEAERSGATVEQLRLLREARASLGGIQYADYEAAVRLSIACIEKAGYLIDGPQTRRYWGLTTLEYGYGTPRTNLTDAEDQAMNEAVSSCQSRFSSFIESAYRGQPSMLQQEAELIEQYTPAIVACIRSHGVDVSDDPTDEERTNALREVIQQKPDFGGPDCMAESGMGPALQAGENG